MNVRKLWSLAAVAAATGLPALVLAPTAGYAQSTPDEIIVSVRRRDENLQEVPLSVSTLSGETINRFGIQNLEDVTKYTPGLQFDQGFGAQDTRVVIRGLSPTRGRSNVALLVDGIDYTGEAVSTAGGGILVNQQLLDVERVEVVKGPQSALYGRSAFAGAIQYVTVKPSLEEWEGNFGVQMGTDGTSGGRGTRLNAAYGGPITDTFGLRVNGLYYDQEGYYRNSLTGQRIGGSDGYGAALSGLWDAGGDITVSGRVAASRDNYEPQAQARIQLNQLIDLDQSTVVQDGTTPTLIRTSGLAAFIGGPTAYPACGPAGTPSDGTVTSCLGAPKALVVGQMPDAYQLDAVLSEDPRTGRDYPGTTVDTITSTFRVDIDVEGGTFSSYTGFAALDSNQFFDGQNDALPPGTYGSLDGAYSFTLQPCGFLDCSPTAQEIGFENETRLVSQEFRFASDFEGPVNFTAGALFWSEKVRQEEFGSTISPAIFRQPTFAVVPPLQPPPVESLPPANGQLANVFTPQRAEVRRDTESFSIYGLVEWDISDNLKATFEGRLVEEELTVAGPICDLTATPALSGLPNVTVATTQGNVTACDPAFRGSSSVATANGSGTLAAGTLTKAVYGSRSAFFDDRFFAPKATLEYTPSDTQLFYASISQGIKPGGISTITAGQFFDPSQNEFKKEKLVAYELGSKSTLLDGRLLVNGALFYQDYTDKQVGVSRFDEVLQTDVGAIENAGEAEIWGLELEITYSVTDRLSLFGGYTYIDSEYSDFVIETSASNNIARSLAAGGQGCSAFVARPGLTLAETLNDGFSETCRVDLTGNQFEDVPEHAFIGNARYVAPMPGDNGLEWYADASLIYRDERFIDEFNVKSLDAFWVTDLRLGILADNYEILLFVDNAFNDDTVKSAVDFGSQVDTVEQGQFPPGPTDGVIVSLPDPRVVGLRLNMQF